MYTSNYSCHILINLELSRQFFEKYAYFKFYENPSNDSRDVPCGRTDMTKLIVTFRNFANAPKKQKKNKFHEVCYIIVRIL
jgi:hypothetical protein